MRELSLFTGAGGGLLGSKLLGWTTVCAVERDTYCQRVLRQRQEDGDLEPFEIHGDILEFDGTPWRGRVDVVSAGFPCQPFSIAGKQRQEKDDRNLWPDTARVLGEVRPRLAFLENASRLVRQPYFGRVLADLHELGFDAEWGVLSAREAGAAQGRPRVWILAHSRRFGVERRGGSRELADPARAREGSGDQRERLWDAPGDSCAPTNWWAEDPAGLAPKPLLDRVAPRFSNRVDRLRALGNGQVPHAMALAWRTLYERIAR